MKEILLKFTKTFLIKLRNILKISFEVIRNSKKKMFKKIVKNVKV